MDWDAVKFPAVPCRPHTFTSMYLAEDFQPKEVYAPDPEYLQATLGQTIEYPGTFPYLNIPQEPNTSRCCVARGDDVARAPLDIWMARHKANLRGHLTERSGRSATSILPAIPTPLSARPQTSALITHHTGEGARRNAYPLSNW